MSRTPTKSLEEYLENKGWSSHHFFDTAKMLLTDRDLTRQITFEYFRSVIYLRSRGKLLKAYVHHNGRSREFLTFTDEKGSEVHTFHCSTPAIVIKRFVLDYFSELL